MAFIEPFLPLSGKNVLFQRIFLVLVLKRLKFNCFMLQSQKMRCLVLSRYPQKDPPERLCISFSSLLFPFPLTQEE